VLLALIFGWFIAGLGHLYVGRLKRGLLILAAGFALLLVPAAIIYLAAQGRGFSSVYYPSSPVVTVAVLMILARIAFFFWQIYDAYKVAKENNERATGSPW